MSYDDRYSDTMKAFFSGKLENDIATKSKMVELGHGIGIGHKDGTYSQYIKALSKRMATDNGTIYLGKAIKEEQLSPDKNIFSIQDPTDKFTVEDVPKLLIMFNTVLNNIRIKVAWKDSDGNTILDQYYDIPSAYSMDHDWWDSYQTYFIGPENLGEGDYSIEIMSKEFGIDDKTKILKASIGFSVVDS